MNYFVDITEAERQGCAHLSKEALRAHTVLYGNLLAQACDTE